MLTRLASQTHEALFRVDDAQYGLCGFIALHTTAAGPVAGGLRIYPCADEDAAIRDTLDLSRNMTFRTAALDLPLGGGSAVMPFDPSREDIQGRLCAMGRAIEALEGQFWATNDMGACENAMAQLAAETRFLAAVDDGEADGPPSVRLAAASTFNAIRIGASYRFGSDDLAGRCVAVQGVGHVGWDLCLLLRQSGANLVVADPDPVLLTGAVHAFGARMSTPRTICSARVDILAPCSVGGVINARSIPSIGAGLIAGAAINQLDREQDAESLHERGILYLPDYLVNGGGIIHPASRILGIHDSADWIDRKMAELFQTLQSILSAAKAANLSPWTLSNRMIRDRLRTYAG
ncbi:MAG: amino acid dehydrogenase, partial [Alphaproteobacteria bacterium]|nr:amino acid dehydrogenase [Alphaproteobacteria bacterium]